MSDADRSFFLDKIMALEAERDQLLTELASWRESAEVMARYMRIGLERPPEYVFEFMREVHVPVPASKETGCSK